MLKFWDCITQPEIYDQPGQPLVIPPFSIAHAVKPPKKFKYAGTRLPYDHKHRHVSDKGVPYEFKDAHQLLSDFFVEVDRVLKEVRKS